MTDVPFFHPSSSGISVISVKGWNHCGRGLGPSGGLKSFAEGVWGPSGGLKTLPEGLKPCRWGVGYKARRTSP